MSTGELANAIEALLLARAGWVSVDDVCSACQVPERLLRADGKRRPIFSRFAISSSTKGLKHISLTTAPERIRYKHSRLKVLIANRRALDEFNRALTNCLTGKRPGQYERHTGQLVFL
ncbi:MAG: hypothetical protein WCS65_09460 [Verrucomicrobiae bacterium]